MQEETPNPEELPQLPEDYTLEDKSRDDVGVWMLKYDKHTTVATISRRDWRLDRFKDRPSHYAIDSFGDQCIFEGGPNLKYSLVFSDLKDAVRVALTMHQTIMAQQIHPDVANVMAQRIRDIAEEYKEAVNRVRELGWECRSLSRVAKKVGMSDHQIETPVDSDDIRRFKEFLNEHSQTLLEALGKYEYRTLKGMMHALIEQIDPAAAATFEEL